jgi:hypothetical protein
MRSVYRFRKERHFAKPPEAIWPFVADSARVNEMVGFPPYRVEERVGVDGRVRRIASGRLGPLRLNWEETFGEWQENRRVVQTRKFLNGPIGYFVACAELEPEGAVWCSRPKSSAAGRWVCWRGCLVRSRARASGALPRSNG